jgi:hypothetical protein
MKQLKRVLTLNCFVLLILTSCASTSFEHPNKRIERQKNACLPSAILLRESLKKYNIWSQVIVFTWEDKNKKRFGHAYCFYEYPKNSGQVWSYCNDWGSYRSSFTKNETMRNIIEANYHRRIFGNVIEFQVLN